MAFIVMGSMFWALIWLLYRAYLVFQTPNDLLVEKLGLDIPPAPEVTLEEITSRLIRVAWKPSDLHNSISKHIVQVNGVKVAETRRSQTAVEISNLLPCRIYHICIVAVSAANFHTSSPVLHVRTKPHDPSEQKDSSRSTSHANTNTSTHSPHSNNTNDEEKVLDDLPVVRPYTPVPSPQPGPALPPSLSKDPSTTHLSSKRGAGGRKSTFSSSANLATDFATSEESQGNAADDDGDTDLPGWSARLLSLQNEMDSLQDQLEREAKEHSVLAAELEERRDELRKQVKEKDEISSDLKRQVNKLEAQNRTVQNEKSKHERILQQRDADRAKRREDVERWNSKLARMEEELQHLKEERERIENKTESRISELRKKITEEQAGMKSLDEEIKTKGGKIKKMEEERRRLEGDDSEENKEFDQLERERDSMWEKKLANLRSHYTSLIAVFTQAQAQYHEAQEHLKWVTAQRASVPVPLPSVSALELDVQRTPMSSMRNRHGGSFASNSSPVAFPLADTSSLFNSTFSNSPTFSGANYLTFPGSGLPSLQDRLAAPALDRNELDDVSHDPPLSPRADSLLPSGLLGDEDHADAAMDSPTARFTNTPRLPLESLFNNSPSPVSSGSRPASRFASPRVSSSNLRETTISSSTDLIAPPPPSSQHQQQQQSSQSSSSQVSQPTDGTAESTSRRLSAFFGFHRQRGKTLGDGPPPLGSLDKGHSNSFPKSEQDLDPIGTRRRRRSHTENWSNPMTGLFPRTQNAAVVPDTSSDHAPLSVSSNNNNNSSGGSVQANTPTRKSNVQRTPMSSMRNRHGGSFASNSSPVAFPLADTSSLFNSTFSNSPTFSGANYLTFPGSGLPSLQDRLAAPALDRNELDDVSHDPPLSPRADSLLPSGLLGDEDHADAAMDSPTARFTNTPRLPLESLFNNSPSPVSSGSRPASRFASPRVSSSNLRETTISSSTDLIAPPPSSSQQQQQQQSSQSSSSQVSQPADGTAESTSRRLSAFFGFHRQRGKTLGDGPPPLGSLDKGHSNSFPKSEQDLDPIGTRRRRRSHTENWSNPMTGLFPRTQNAAVVPDTSSDHAPLSVSSNNNNSSGSVQANTPTRKSSMFSSLFPASRFFNKQDPASERGYNQFSPRHDPIDPSILVRGESSPRPSSTYSRENPFPQPGSDNTLFGWPVQERLSNPNRVSPLGGADWPSPVSWSRSQSRRQSTSLGSSTHLPVIPSSTEPEFLQSSSALPVQAPIGTRPPSSHHAPSTPKLNPAAPSFKTIFSKKLEKVKSKDSSEAKSHNDDEEAFDAKEESPASRRGSHSTKSIQASIAESNDSVEPAASVTPSESSAKESFMQKLSRKSSSSKFSISWKDRGSLFSKKDPSSSSEKLAQGENDEDSCENGAGAGKSVEGNGNGSGNGSSNGNASGNGNGNGNSGSTTGDRSSKGSSFFKRKSRKASSAGKNAEESTEMES
ncbi:fibronectin type III domain-containing protein [Ascosphaera apis ARSEF 7405]|uniref:Fibronectin type III domain-containing protein n=1 Tax=Ascosphaera apis ARSEF 7405 TaxID=392613 RepID=A0A168DSG5_9EURO|nr:fibronectin type III domain-containing protein [Ascosphaera apis ARSEF 7405]